MTIDEMLRHVQELSKMLNDEAEARNAAIKAATKQAESAARRRR